MMLFIIHVIFVALSAFVVSGPPGGHANFLLPHAWLQVKPYVTWFFVSEVLRLNQHGHASLTVSAQVNNGLTPLRNVMGSIQKSILTITLF